MKSLIEYIKESVENEDLVFMAKIEHKMKSHTVKFNFENTDKDEIEKKYKNEFEEEVTAEYPSYGIVYSGAKTHAKLVWTQISNNNETKDITLCQIPTEELVKIIKSYFIFKDGEFVRNDKPLKL